MALYASPIDTLLEAHAAVCVNTGPVMLCFDAIKLAAPLFIDDTKLVGRTRPFSSNSIIEFFNS